MLNLNRQNAPIWLSMIDPLGQGAGGVLNDFFEERGQPKVVPKDFDLMEPSARFACILDKLLPRNIATMLACDFAEHVLDRSSLDETSLRSAEDLLERQRKFLIECQTRGKKTRGKTESDARWISTTKHNLNVAAHNFFYGRSIGVRPFRSSNRVAQAVWEVVTGKPSNVAISAQSAYDDERDWQRQHLAAEITRIANEVSNEMAT